MTPEVTALIIQSAFTLVAEIAPEAIKLFGSKLSPADVATLNSFQDLVTRIDFDKKIDTLMEKGDMDIIKALVAKEKKNSR